jgi:hypothetical protein
MDATILHDLKNKCAFYIRYLIVELIFGLLDSSENGK